MSAFTSAPLRLLVVDDSNIIRSRIARIVSDGSIPGLQVVGTARNGAEALRCAEQVRPNIVTMDLTMPELDGIDCVPKLMAFDPGLHILVVSALSDKSTAMRALKLGARGFLHKPFTDDQLKLALVELISA